MSDVLAAGILNADGTVDTGYFCRGCSYVFWERDLDERGLCHVCHGEWE